MTEDLLQLLRQKATERRSFADRLRDEREQFTSQAMQYAAQTAPADRFSSNGVPLAPSQVLNTDKAFFGAVAGAASPFSPELEMKARDRETDILTQLAQIEEERRKNAEGWNPETDPQLQRELYLRALEKGAPPFDPQKDVDFQRWLAKEEVKQAMAKPDSEKNRSASDAKLIAAAKTGIGAVERSKEKLKDGGGVMELFGATTPLTPWGRELESDLFDAVDIILRQRTGAQAPEEEVRNYLKQKGPRITDSPETRMAKLDKLQQELEESLSQMGASMSGFNEDALINEVLGL